MYVVCAGQHRWGPKYRAACRVRDEPVRAASRPPLPPNVRRAELLRRRQSRPSTIICITVKLSLSPNMPCPRGEQPSILELPVGPPQWTLPHVHPSSWDHYLIGPPILSVRGDCAFHRRCYIPPDLGTAMGRPLDRACEGWGSRAGPRRLARARVAQRGAPFPLTRRRSIRA